MANFVGNLDVGNSVAAPHRDVKCPHGVARDFFTDGVAPTPQRLRQGKLVGVFSNRVAVVRKKPRRFWITLFLPFLVGFQPCGQSIMDQHERIYGLLIFRPAHTERLAILGDPTRFKRLGIRPKPQGFARPQTGERFKHHLPAERLGADVGKHQRGDFMQRFSVVRHELPAVPDIFGAAIARTTEVKRVLPDEVTPHGPEDGIAQGVHFHVHGPVAAPFRGVLPPPRVVAVAFNEANIRRQNFVPEFQQHRTIPRFHFQGAASARLFLPVGINVFLVVPDNVADGHGRFCIVDLNGADARAAAIQFFAGVFQIGGVE